MATKPSGFSPATRLQALHRKMLDLEKKPTMASVESIIGVSQRRISNVVHGRSPSSRVEELLAKVVGIDPDVFFPERLTRPHRLYAIKRARREAFEREWDKQHAS